MIEGPNTSPEKIFEKINRVASGVDQLLADFLEPSCDIELDYLEISQPFIQMTEGPNAPPSPTKPQSGPAKPCCTPSTGSIARVMPLESSQVLASIPQKQSMLRAPTWDTRLSQIACAT
ncbi:hypothetical protein LEN26_015213 [Aphanomyces euteiches]|nr:hypothetical protein LEN26_015213 [Aphanomyces euteiches]